MFLQQLICGGSIVYPRKMAESKRLCCFFCQKVQLFFRILPNLLEIDRILVYNIYVKVCVTQVTEKGVH